MRLGEVNTQIHELIFVILDVYVLHSFPVFYQIYLKYSNY